MHFCDLVHGAIYNTICIAGRFVEQVILIMLVVLEHDCVLVYEIKFSRVDISLIDTQRF